MMADFQRFPPISDEMLTFLEGYVIGFGTRPNFDQFEKDRFNQIADVIAELRARRAMTFLPAEPTEEMTNHPTYLSGQWSRDNYAGIMTAAKESK